MIKQSVITGLVCLLTVQAMAQHDASELTKQLANPLASLISVPTQINFDENIGSDEKGSQVQINIQPVIPFTLNDDWLLISRTIIPLTDQDDIPFKGEGESGLGDILQSFFFSPSETTKSGWIWGAGPVVLLPTASDDSLGADQFSMGPTAVALK